MPQPGHRQVKSSSQARRKQSATRKRSIDAQNAHNASEAKVNHVSSDVPGKDKSYTKLQKWMYSEFLQFQDRFRME